MTLAKVNRTDPEAFVRVLDESIERNRKLSRNVGLLVIHVEQFSRVVSGFSYRAADLLIAELANRLRENARSHDTVARIGDSKFAVIIDQIHNEGHLILAANKLSRVGDPAVLLDDTSINMELRVGAALADSAVPDADALVRLAETALLDAVDAGEPYVLAEPGEKHKARDLLALQRELDTGLGLGEFEIYLQPKVTADTRVPCGAESLLRWNNARRGMVPPDQFIPLADQTQRIHALTNLVLHTALRNVSSLEKRIENFSIAVNVTPSTLEHEEFVEGVTSAMGLWGIKKGQLIIEVTEGALIRNPDLAFHALNRLREHGAMVSIDDFGTGYSSLAYFRDIPADELKIDRSFVMNILDDKSSVQIVETIIRLAHGFGLSVVAEGVENEEVAVALNDMGCDCLQGFYFSKPLPIDEFRQWLAAPACNREPTRGAGR